MSRAVWGAVTASSLKNQDADDGKKQLTLTEMMNKKRRAEDRSGSIDETLAKEREAQLLAIERQKRGRSDPDAKELYAVVKNEDGSLVERKVEQAKAPPKTLDLMKLNAQEIMQNRPDDAVCWGPSGGGDRDTSGFRKLSRPFMQGREMNKVFHEASPYSRQSIKEWRKVYQTDEDRAAKKADAVKKESGADQVKTEGREGIASSTSTTTAGGDGGRSEFTSFSYELLEPYLAPNCPRDIFRGKVFFLNSCDADPQISVYNLEKLIRYLGGVTSMGAGGHCTYIVTQHLCSAKENRLLGRPGQALKPGALRSSDVKKKPTYIHPHFILACAKEGKLVSEALFKTIQEASSINPASLIPKASKKKDIISHQEETTTLTTAPKLVGLGTDELKRNDSGKMKQQKLSSINSAAKKKQAAAAAAAAAAVPPEESSSEGMKKESVVVSISDSEHSDDEIIIL